MESQFGVFTKVVYKRYRMELNVIIEYYQLL